MFHLHERYPLLCMFAPSRLFMRESHLQERHAGPTNFSSDNIMTSTETLYPRKRALESFLPHKTNKVVGFLLQDRKRIWDVVCPPIVKFSKAFILVQFFKTVDIVVSISFSISQLYSPFHLISI